MNLSTLVQTHDPLQWLIALVPFVVLAALAAWLWRVGTEKGLGLPTWAGAGVVVGTWSLAVALIGFHWDVGWHADLGRDAILFTVAHTMILIGLAGMGAAGALAILLASLERAPVGFRLRLAGRELRVPYSALPLLLVSAGAQAGFPLDDWWHKTYGIDVTMWSPTHLMMIGGASLAPIAIWLMAAEAGPVGTAKARWWLAGAVLIGLSTFQLEFDFGIPQFQLLFHPLLIVAAAGVGLVAARAALGRGGALAMVAGFLFLRLLVSVLVGPGFGHGFARFPLYLGEALAVEGAFLYFARWSSLALAAVSGLLAAVVGLATEWLWVNLWYQHPWGAPLLPYLWLALLMGPVAATVGMAMGRVVGGGRAGVPAPAVALALAMMAGLLVIHLPARQATPARLTMHSQQVGASHTVRDRNGVYSQARDILVTVDVNPPAAVRGSDWFELVAWQGGGVQHARLVETSPGHYRASGPVPVGGNWKVLVFNGRGDVVQAAPVSMPPDPQYGLHEVAAPDEGRAATFQPASQLLMRESHGGSPLPALVAYTAFVALVALWVAALGWAFQAVARQATTEPEPARRAARRPAIS